MKAWKATAVLMSVLSAGFAMTVHASADNIDPETGWYTDASGKRFYKNTDGSVAVGTVEIDGVPYVFAPNGVQQLGWQTVNDLRYYYNPDGSPVFGWLNWRGENYYITKEAGKQVQAVQTDNQTGISEFDQFGVVKQGWDSTEDGKWLYRDEHGIPVADCTRTIDGIAYQFDKDAHLLTGWQTIESITRYYDPQTGTAPSGFIKLDGKKYYVDAEKGLLTGFQTIDGTDYYFDMDGTQLFGIITLPDGTTRHFREPYGTSHGLTTVNDYLYFFDEAGIMQKGFVQIGDNTHLFGDDGKMLFGLQKVGDKLYYLDPYGVMYRGLHTDHNGSYLFDETGAAVSGFGTYDGKTYYSDKDFRLLTGYQTIAEKNYYFDSDGSLKTDWFEIDGIKHHADENGVLSAGVVTLSEKQYCFNEKGTMQTGIVKRDAASYLYGEDGVFCASGLHTYQNAVYYCGGKDGALLSGWQTLSDGKRYFTADFKMQTGWNMIDGKMYYFDSNGIMLTGTQTIEKTTYSFSEEGVLVNELVLLDKSAYLFNDKGQPVTGWYTLNGAKYYCGTAGTPVSGWKTISNKAYYFNPKTYQMAVSTTVDGFVIDDKGIGRTQNAVKVDSQLASAGTTPKSIFTYFVGRYKYRRNESTRTYTQLTNSGWDTLITYLLKNKRGVCYYLAATYDYFCQRAGFTTRLVHATHSTGNHYWVQVKINGTWHNFDPTYSSRNDISWSSQIALGNYTILGYVQLSYDSRGALLGAKYTKYS